ncbi:Pumilio-like protein [Thalictrum thalictroides]|uniref:Pumilio-like protein n=1 Tax=Thalictrum thalictroides TaxID=46969 RepID=A0A7J6WMV3_THATH|nr:Pumilio-like protein [Thalictrum thalictroides]
MACFGSKSINSKSPNSANLVTENSVAMEGDWKKNNKKNRRKQAKEEQTSGRRSNNNKNNQDYSNVSNSSETTIVRKQVDPETMKYFAEIANAIEGNGIDYEERSVICGNALEEAEGKELELATDYIISHTMQSLLQGCDVHHLCGFLQSCAKEFTLIATDRSGSHVAETALKSLTMHVQDEESYNVVEETLGKICEVIAVKPVDMMCNPHGSHVLRSLLCICKGVPLDSSEEFHVTKSTNTLAERLNTKAGQSVLNELPQAQPGFPNLLKFLAKEMLKYGGRDIATLQVDQYGSLVLQTALKLLVGEDQVLMHIIPLLLGCKEENIRDGNMIESTPVHHIVNLLKDNAFSHLMEVILEVAPDTLYDEIFTRIFRNSLFKISSDHCGSFVIQALVSSARCQGQMDLIWDELGGHFKELFANGMSGVIASLVAASQRLHKHEQKCCQALAGAVCSTSESPSCIVPRILFLESYFWSEDKTNWKWSEGGKMNVLGCLMLQAVFKYPSEFIQSYVTSLLSMEADYVLETAKNAGGGRVIESFLCSGVSTKQKRKLIAKLRGRFGELAMHPSGSFTVEKCFSASSVSLKETIVSELLVVRAQLSKTKQGPYLSRKLDIDGFAARPDQWRSRQESKENTYKDFYDTFGSSKVESSKGKRFRTEPSSGPAPPKGVKQMRKEVDQFLASSSTPSSGINFPGIEASMAKLGFSGLKRSHDRSEKHGSKKLAKIILDFSILMEGGENLLEIIFGDEPYEDIDMLDADSVEEGEIGDDKQCIQYTETDSKELNRETVTENPRPKSKKKKKRNKRKNKPRPVSTITDINRFVLDTCKRLKEKKSYLIWNAVGCLGVAAFSDLVKEVDAIEACGGQMTADGKRPRNGGGILWNILKTREPKAYKEIMTKGRELERQLKKPNSRQGPTQAKDTLSSESIMHKPSDQVEDQASDGLQNTAHVQDEFEPSYDHGRRVSALNRIRVPVSYDDLLGEEVKK